MTPIRISDLPPPPANRTGWPWTEGSGPPADTDRPKQWPRISIVTPSYNQADYLEETIRSVLLQGYPDLEFIIMDGGSTDCSKDIIRRYAGRLTAWASESDQGQSDAINKGFRLSTGTIFGWLCSDDTLTPGALFEVARAFSASPECDAAVGGCRLQFDDEPEKNGDRRPLLDSIQRNPYAFGIWQPSCFFRRSLIVRPDVVRNELHFCMDRELWCYLVSRQCRWKQIDAVLSVNRFTGLNKSLTGKDKVIRELDLVYRTYVSELLPLTSVLARIWLPLVRLNARHHSRFIRRTSRFLSAGVSLLMRAFYPGDRVRALRIDFMSHGL